MIWLKAIVSALMRISLFAFRGGLTNAYAGAVEGVVAGIALWLIGIMMKPPPGNFLSLYFRD